MTYAETMVELIIERILKVIAADKIDSDDNAFEKRNSFAFYSSSLNYVTAAKTHIRLRRMTNPQARG